MEVSSPSTARYDRVVKGPQYREIEALRDLLLIARDAVGVQHWQRGADGEWSVREIVDPHTKLTLTNGAMVEIAAMYARTVDLPIPAE